MKTWAVPLMVSVLFLVSMNVSHAQIHDSGVEIYFRVGSSSYDPSFRGNRDRVDSFASEVKRLAEDSSLHHYTIDVYGAASPDGPLSLNERLAGERLGNALAALEAAGVDLSAFHDVRRHSSVARVTDWSAIADAVASDLDVPERETVLSVLADSTLTSAEKEKVLKNQRGGVWNYLKTNVLTAERVFRAVIRCRVELRLDSAACPLPVSVEDTAPEVSPVPAFPPFQEPPAQPADWTRKLTVKTNAAALALLMGNAAVEVDLTRNLSVHVPVYYSALNYFTSTIKFRTFAVQPELRWNFTRPAGLFAGAHFGLAYFNLAVDGNWRIQTHNGNEPLLGGGVSVGYRLPISRDRRWNVEFCIGAGAYRFNYDKFYNEPNGALAGSVSRTYIGVDNAAVSFTYSFDLGRGGKRK